jgi:membrane protease YdiL (CAAX protease family)
MAENAYLALAQKGKNAFWRYLVTNLAIIVSAIAVQTVALILILILTGKMEAIIGSGNQLLDTLPPLIVLLLGMAPFPVALVILGLGLWLLHGRSRILPGCACCSRPPSG